MSRPFYWGNSPGILKAQIDHLTEKNRDLERDLEGQDIGVMLWFLLCGIPLTLLGLGFIAVQIWGLS